jgi:hypothetical protein
MKFSLHSVIFPNVQDSYGNYKTTISLTYILCKTNHYVTVTRHFWITERGCVRRNSNDLGWFHTHAGCPLEEKLTTRVCPLCFAYRVFICSSIHSCKMLQIEDITVNTGWNCLVYIFYCLMLVQYVVCFGILTDFGGVYCLHAQGWRVIRMYGAEGRQNWSVLKW